MSNHHTLFSIANRFFRENRLEEAIFIYEHLAATDPGFAPYAENEADARKALAALCGDHSVISRKFHLSKATDSQRRLRIADVLCEYKKPELLDACGELQGAAAVQMLLARASASVGQGMHRWLKYVNKYLAAYDLAPLSLVPKDQRTKKHPYLNLRGAVIPPVEGPLVTICVACFNAEPYVEHAINSLLGQSYRNIEIFAFNDRSTDGTLRVLRDLEKRDSRLRVIDNAENQGTYISRNQALQEARGEFFTILDADDFALPERIAIQVIDLLENPEIIGNLTEWVRMHEDGRFHFRAGWGGCYQHEAVATLMFRTERVRSQVGFWDSVRFAADTEFKFRLKRAFGDKSVPLRSRPTVISLFHEASLTNHPVTGIGVGGVSGLSPTRIEYRQSWEAWHKTNFRDLYLSYPLEKRAFPAPDEMLPHAMK